jgi:hypothetical protein
MMEWVFTWKRPSLDGVCNPSSFDRSNADVFCEPSEDFAQIGPDDSAYLNAGEYEPAF